MTAYYNEHDPFAAAWLRELIKAGHIAPGVVDERSIEDILPSDLAGFTQYHFFAGIGVWSYALRRAGWPDDRPVWTGSCPCQPFSAAGKGSGFTDERHLWPAWFHLITTAKSGAVPVFGEQVASKDGLGWLDLVQNDMEAAGHAFGAVDLCAAGVGAPHIRQRLFFVAEGMEHPELSTEQRQRPVCGAALRLEETTGPTGDYMAYRLGDDASHPGMFYGAETTPDAGGLADADGRNPSAERKQPGWQHGQQQENGRDVRGESCWTRVDARSELERPGPTNGLWRDADWLYCRDGKFRPVEPGTFPLAHGAPARVGRLRGYGNAINAEVAAGFIGAYLNAKI